MINYYQKTVIRAKKKTAPLLINFLFTIIRNQVESFSLKSSNNIKTLQSIFEMPIPQRSMRFRDLKTPLRPIVKIRGKYKNSQMMMNKSCVKTN